MEHFVYILYSPSLDKFYVGETKDLKDRIHQHNKGFYKNSFTKLAQDWELYLSLECKSISQARKIEKHIKRMKSKKYYHSLKAYPELVVILLNKFI